MDFANLVSEGRYQTPWHVQLLNKHLMDVHLGKTKRLRISMPPRHSKSQTVSEYFTAWWLLMHPHDRVMLASYQGDFAATWGRKARDLVEAHGYLFDVKVDRRSASASRWDIEGYDGGMTTAGVGGPIVGKGADILVLDDVVANAEDARSKTIQDKTFDWYSSTAFPRLHPGGAVIVMMTRWNENDLIGKIEDQERMGNSELKDPYPWVTLNLPAIAEEDEEFRQTGEALWPERYSVEELMGIRRNVTEYWWNAQYQGHPAPNDGLIYRASGTRYWAVGNENGEPGYILKKPTEDGRFVYDRFVAESKCSIFISVDLAVSEKQTADWTVMMVWSVTPSNELILLDLIRSHMSGPEKIPTMQRLKNRWGASFIVIERFGYQLETIQNARFAGLPIKESAMKGDKVAKSWESSAKWESGQIFLQESASYNEDLLSELYSFPNGKKDDQCDSLAIAAAEVSKMGNPMDAYGIVVCENQKCLHKFVRNARVGLQRACPKCGSRPLAPSSLQPIIEPNALS